MTLSNSAISPEQNLKTSYRDWWQATVGLFTFFMVMPLMATAWLSGKSSAEKMLTLYAQPYFLFLMLMLLMGCVSLRRGQKGVGWVLIGAVTLLWVLSTSVVVGTIFRYWERTVTSAIPTKENPFDYVVVLGGGTGTAPDGSARFGKAGDRVGYAAMLFMEGKTRNLITTGDTLIMKKALSGSYGVADDPSVQTREIWNRLGIPNENIFEVSGQNTFAELSFLRNHPEWWQGKRCGLVTSAFHLPRAMKLAEKAGVQVEPLAADFRANESPLVFKNFFPEAGELEKLDLLIKEWIAISIRR